MTARARTRPRWAGPAAAFALFVAATAGAQVAAAAPSPTVTDAQLRAAERRGNASIARDLRGMVWSVAALPRVPVLIGGGSAVITEVGVGAALQARWHALAVGPFRLGLALEAGWSQWIERRTFTVDRELMGTGTGIQEVQRYARLAHGDFAFGPSVQLPLGPVFVELTAAAGVTLSTLVRPLGPSVADEVMVEDVAPSVRGNLQVGVPLRGDHGLVVGVGVLKVFSERRVDVDPGPVGSQPPPDAERAIVFDLVLEPFVGYQRWF